MPGASVLIEQVQPFVGIDMPTDVRLSITYQDADNWTIDHVEVPSRDDATLWHNPRDGWRIINRLHPLYAGINPTLDSAKTTDAIIDAILADIAQSTEMDGDFLRDRGLDMAMHDRDLVDAMEPA